MLRRHAPIWHEKCAGNISKRPKLQAQNVILGNRGGCLAGAVALCFFQASGTCMMWAASSGHCSFDSELSKSSISTANSNLKAVKAMNCFQYG